MEDFIIQALSLIALIAGVMFGELLTLKAFGRPKRVALMLDIILFVILVTGIFYCLGFYAADAVFYAANFFVGLIAIVLTRTIEAALGLTERVASAGDVAEKLVPVLAKAGLDADEIKSVLLSIGVSAKLLDKLSAKVDKAVPPYLPKIVRIYDELDDIRAQLALLAAAVAHGARSKRAMRAARSTEMPAEHPRSAAAPDKYAGIRHMIQAAIQRAERESAEARGAQQQATERTESAQSTDAETASPAKAVASAAPTKKKRTRARRKAKLRKPARRATKHPKKLRKHKKPARRAHPKRRRR
ncbi:MAG: hypothetical protein QW548_00815 [Candidatus Aenigmatarchaeota archaeon]